MICAEGDEGSGLLICTLPAYGEVTRRHSSASVALIGASP